MAIASRIGFSSSTTRIVATSPNLPLLSVSRGSLVPQRPSESGQQARPQWGRARDLDALARPHDVFMDRSVVVRETHLEDGAHPVELAAVFDVPQQQQTLRDDGERSLRKAE